MKRGIPQAKVNTGQFQPGVVIAAEIAFAALLLYLTNHPVSLDEFTRAENSVAEHRTLLENPPANVAVASAAIRPLNRPPVE